jgi:hypothetical protein
MSSRRERAKELTAKQNKQLHQKEEVRNSLAIRSRKLLHTAEIYFDIAKLVFGGVIIGSVIEAKDNWQVFLIVGMLTFFALIGIGNNYYNKGNKTVGL